MSEVAHTLTMLLTCLGGDECTVYVEPWGSEHLLKKGDLFTLTVSGSAASNVEVSYVANGIIVGIRDDVDATLTDRSGARLTI